jgi:hypothetical protein
LAVTVGHEIGNLLLHGVDTLSTAALSKTVMFPHILRVGVVSTVGVVARVRIEGSVSGRLGVSGGILSSSL